MPGSSAPKTAVCKAKEGLGRAPKLGVGGEAGVDPQAGGGCQWKGWCGLLDWSIDGRRTGEPRALGRKQHTDLRHRCGRERKGRPLGDHGVYEVDGGGGTNKATSGDTGQEGSVGSNSPDDLLVRLEGRTGKGRSWQEIKQRKAGHCEVTSKLQSRPALNVIVPEL